MFKHLRFCCLMNKNSSRDIFLSFNNTMDVLNWFFCEQHVHPLAEFKYHFIMDSEFYPMLHCCSWVILLQLREHETALPRLSVTAESFRNSGMGTTTLFLPLTEHRTQSLKRLISSTAGRTSLPRQTLFITSKPYQAYCRWILLLYTSLCYIKKSWMQKMFSDFLL